MQKISYKAYRFMHTGQGTWGRGAKFDSVTPEYLISRQLNN